MLVQRVPRHNVPLRFSLYRKMDIINITFRMASRHISPLTLPGIVEKSESNGGVNVDHVMRHVTPRQEGLATMDEGEKNEDLDLYKCFIYTRLGCNKHRIYQVSLI